MGLADRYRTQTPTHAGSAFTTGIQQRQLLEQKDASHTLAIMKANREKKMALRQQELDSAVEDMYVKEGHNPLALVRLSRKYGDIMSDGMMEQATAQEKKLHTSLAQPVYAAANNGNYKLAADLAKKAGERLQELDPDEAEQYTMFAESIVSDDPRVRDAALDSAGMILMEVMGVDDFQTMSESLKTVAETDLIELETETEQQKQADKQVNDKLFDAGSNIRKMLQVGNYSEARDIIDTRIEELSSELSPKADVMVQELFQVRDMIESETPEHAVQQMDALLSNVDPERFSATAADELKLAQGDQATATAAKNREDAKTAKLTRKKLDQEITKTAAEMKRLAKEGGGTIAPEKRPAMELQLRNQYLKEGGTEARKIGRAYRNIEGASETGVGGLTTILSFMKVLDPTSVVSPGEQATAANASGWSDSMQTMWNKYTKEGQLSAGALKQFKAEAKRLADEASKDARDAEKRIRRQSKEYGLDVGNIFLEEEAPATSDNPVVQQDSDFLDGND